MLCIGCEMVRADAREAEWRSLIAEIRAVYSGLVTYNCDKYQEDRLTWWDAVDVISSSGYYPIGTWDEHLDRIEAVVEASGKPFFFMEAGCPSRTGSSARPNDWTLEGEPSGDEQLRYYREMFEACARATVDAGLHAVGLAGAPLPDRGRCSSTTTIARTASPREPIFARPIKP